MASFPKIISIVVFIAVVIFGIVLLSKNSKQDTMAYAEESSSEESQNNQNTENQTEEKIITNNNDNQEKENMNEGIVHVVMKTNKGDIHLELWKNLAPNTVENFTTLANNGYYDGTRFHRVIEGFMIQGGDPLSKDTAQINRWGTGGPGYQFADEIHAENHNMAGTISMANAGPNTNGSQFFINVSDNTYLDTKHTVFGKVIKGYEIVETISMVDTIPGVDRPVEDVIINSIDVEI